MTSPTSTSTAASGASAEPGGAGPDTAAAAPAPPSAHRRAFITWLAVYPTITVALTVLGPVTGGLPVWLRTLVLTAVVVPIVAYALIPWLMKANAKLTARAARR